jgi:hypothetical protein
MNIILKISYNLQKTENSRIWIQYRNLKISTARYRLTKQYTVYLNINSFKKKTVTG